MHQPPWVTFCISTYKRPQLLHKQLAHLLQQTFLHFEIVISDNDPGGSARAVAASFQDERIRYFHNEENLGMMKSFNRSIDHATSAYIVMVTDDDPVKENFLADMYELCRQYPGYSLYGGFTRGVARQEAPTFIDKDRFVTELLDPARTPDILWSSCVLERQAALAAGKIPDYGSPHLADHAFVAMAGSIGGGVVVNRMYSTLTQHENNFSKFNIEYYTVGCKGFYEVMNAFCKDKKGYVQNRKIVLKHIGTWFIATMFTLKRYHTVTKNREMICQVDNCARQIISFPFMQPFRPKFYAKSFIFRIKKALHLL